MKKLLNIGIICVTVMVVNASCAQETCPGNGSYRLVSPRKITHNSSKIKVRESMIHSHKPGGRKPPKKLY